MNLDIFRPKEKFLILEITPHGTNGLFVDVDDDRKIVCKKLVHGGALKKFVKAPARKLSEKEWDGKKLFNNRRRVIAAADSSLATTMPIPLELVREPANIKLKITLAELENLVAQAMAKIFNATRSEAAKRLNRDELDAVMVGARAKRFAVDGKAHTTPVGVTGKKIALLLELTFAARPVFDDLKPFFNAPEDFFFAEAPQAALQALARVRTLPVSMVKADDRSATLYVLEEPKGEYAVLYREKMDWAFGSLINAITNAFAVNDAAATRLYHLYRKGGMSEGASRVFKKTVDPSLQSFLAALTHGNVKGEVYLDLPHALPLSMPHKHGKATLTEYPAEELLHALGFTLAPDAPCAAMTAGEDKHTILHPLLYFIEAYFNKDDTNEINQKLRRRLHWLAL